MASLLAHFLNFPLARNLQYCSLNSCLKRVAINEKKTRTLMYALFVGPFYFTGREALKHVTQRPPTCRHDHFPAQKEFLQEKRKKNSITPSPPIRDPKCVQPSANRVDQCEGLLLGHHLFRLIRGAPEKHFQTRRQLNTDCAEV